MTDPQFYSTTDWLLSQILSLMEGAASTMRFGENNTGALLADNVYRIKFTTTAGVLMTYANASYILQAIDPNTGANVAVDFLADGDTSGEYTPENSFRLRVLEDMPAGLIIRHCGR
jgi:hypothetical protein